MTRKAILLLFAVLILLPLSRVVGQTKSITEHLQSANTLMQEGKFDEATNEYDQVLKVAPNNPGALSGRAWAKFLRKDLDGAITDSDKLVKLYPKASGIEKIHNLRGIIFTILLNSEAAFREFSKSIEINPNYSDSYNGRGNIFFERKQYQKARVDYDKALELQPKAVASLLGRGDVWLKLGETAKARLDYDAALELYPTSSEGHLNRGILRALEGEWDSAVEDIELAVTLNKQNRSPFSRNLSVALADLDEYILNNPTKANGLIVRGIIKLFIEKFDEADVDFGKAFELNQSLKIDLEPGLKNLRKVLEENRKNQN